MDVSSTLTKNAPTEARLPSKAQTDQTSAQKEEADTEKQQMALQEATSEHTKEDDTPRIAENNAVIERLLKENSLKDDAIQQILKENAQLIAKKDKTIERLEREKSEVAAKKDKTIERLEDEKSEVAAKKDKTIERLEREKSEIKAEKVAIETEKNRQIRLLKQENAKLQVIVQRPSRDHHPNASTVKPAEPAAGSTRPATPTRSASPTQALNTISLNWLETTFLSTISLAGAFTEAFFATQALLQWAHTPQRPGLSLPLALLVLAPNSLPLEYAEASHFYKKHYKSQPTIYRALKSLRTQGTAVALLPATAHLCLFYMALSDGLPDTHVARCFSIALPVMTAFLYLMVEGTALNTLLKRHIFQEDKDYVRWLKSQYRHAPLKKYLRYLYITGVNLANFLAAAAFLIPVVLDAYSALAQALDLQHPDHYHKLLPTYYGTILLSAGYLGGQLCLMGHQFKRASYAPELILTFVGAQLRQFVAKSRYRAALKSIAALWAFGDPILMGIVAFYFMQMGFQGLFPSVAETVWLRRVLPLLCAMPLSLQVFTTYSVRTLAFLNGNRAAWDELNAHLDTACALSGEHTPLRVTTSRSAVPFMSFCRFYIGLLQMGAMVGVKMTWELFNPTASVTECIVSYLMTTLTGVLLQFFMLDLLPYLCRSSDAPTLSAPFAEGADPILSSRLLLYLITWWTGVGAQYALKSLFTHVDSDEEALTFQSEVGGALIASLMMLAGGFFVMHRWPLWGKTVRVATNERTLHADAGTHTVRAASCWNALWSTTPSNTTDNDEGSDSAPELAVFF